MKYCSLCGNPTESGSDQASCKAYKELDDEEKSEGKLISTVASAVVAGATGSAILGFLVGGDIGGAILGDLMDGDLMD